MLYCTLFYMATLLHDPQAGALLRQRCYGAAVSFVNDERAVHLLEPYTLEPALEARARAQVV